MGSFEHNFEGSSLVQVHCSKILLVQVRFGFTKMKRFIQVYGSGSGSVQHPDFNAIGSHFACVQNHLKELDF